MLDFLDGQINYHASDLGSYRADEILDEVVDGDTNFLASLSWIHLRKACNEHF